MKPVDPRKATTLFNGRPLHEWLQERSAAMRSEINAVDRDKLLQANPDVLVEQCATKYLVNPVSWSGEVELIEHGPGVIDLTGDPRGALYHDRARAKCYFTIFALPFEGEPEIFRRQPSRWSTPLPRGEIFPGELRVTVMDLKNDGPAMRAELERTREVINEHLGYAHEDVERFNAGLPKWIRKAVEQRREALLEELKQVAAMGVKVRPAVSGPVTFVAPLTRKPLPILESTGAGTAFLPEPVLDMQHYEHILKVIADATAVIERNPDSFQYATEQTFRDHILVQLNGHYEGMATGETFNAGGRTDILVRVGDRNVFIGECKIWHARGVIMDGIDQLLSYATWRDTKTALILFNRNDQVSSLLESIPRIVSEHRHFKRQVRGYQNEAGRRFILRQPDDAERELMLTVLVVQVPAALRLWSEKGRGKR